MSTSRWADSPTRLTHTSIGGAVHNLYRNNWHQVINYRDNLAQERPPEQWAIDFGEAFKNVVTQNTGPALRRGMARLMQHPQYRDAVSPPSSSDWVVY